MADPAQLSAWSADVPLLLDLHTAARATPALGQLARMLSHLAAGLSLVLAAAGIAMVSRTRRAYATWIGVWVAAGAADLLAHRVLKPIIARARPCQVMDNVDALVRCGTGYSMPSNHAATGAAMAVVFVLLSDRPAWVKLLFAAVGFGLGASRPLVGVHFPSDVLVGWGLGALIGLFVQFPATKIALRLPASLVRGA